MHKGGERVDRITGATGICMNNCNQMLMVLQGKPEEKKKWAVPSGITELNETFEVCCIREVFEETGYQVTINKKLHTKKIANVEIQYFLVELINGHIKIQDPDGLIYDVAWKEKEELHQLPLTFEEDRDFLLSCF